MSEAMGDFMWPEERAGLERDSSKWWAFLALGVVSAVLGIILMLDLFAAVTTLALLAAFGLIVTGIGELMSAGRYRSTLGIVAGVVLIVGGVLAAAWPDIMGALSLRIEGWGWLLFAGVLSVIVGLLALAWPDATILVLGLLLGIRMLLFGIAEIMFGLALHHVHSN
jgi:uncharacterized membrane protein HdeD (DUF308 family)